MGGSSQVVAVLYWWWGRGEGEDLENNTSYTGDDPLGLGLVLYGPDVCKVVLV